MAKYHEKFLVGMKNLGWVAKGLKRPFKKIQVGWQKYHTMKNWGGGIYRLTDKKSQYEKLGWGYIPVDWQKSHTWSDLYPIMATKPIKFLKVTSITVTTGRVMAPPYFVLASMYWKCFRQSESDTCRMKIIVIIVSVFRPSKYLDLCVEISKFS